MSALWEEIQNIKATSGVANIYSASVGTYTLKKANANVIVEGFSFVKKSTSSGSYYERASFISTAIINKGETKTTSIISENGSSSAGSPVTLTVTHNGTTLGITKGSGTLKMLRVIEIG